MNGFLVTLVGTMDDLPVRLFERLDDAERFIETYRPIPVEGVDAATAGPLRAAADVAGYGPKYVLGYAITQFRNGRPVSRVTRRWAFEGENSDWPGPGKFSGLSAGDRQEWLNLP